MKIAYLLMVHKYPKLFARLIKALKTDETEFYVHVDKKTDIEPFKNALKDQKLNGNIFFIEERVKAHWAAWSVVQGMINLMNFAIKSNFNPDYVILLSGQCYPIKSNQFISDFLEKNKGKEIIDIWFKKIWNSDRLKYRWYFEFDNFYIKGILKHLSQKLLPKRKFFEEIVPYQGSAWWAFTFDFVKYFVNYLDNNPKFTKFFHTVLIPDEEIFHTVLYNSPFKDKIWDRSLHFIDWHRIEPPQANPSILNKNDIFLFKQDAKHLFARKFSPRVDLEILDLIDEMRKQIS